LHLKGRGELPLLDQPLLEQVVDSGHLIVFVAIQTLRSIVLFETIAFEVAEQRRLDGDLVLADNEALTFADGLISLIPGVLLDLGRS